MAKRSQRNTRGRIVNAAWKLFYEQGYEDTTIEDIVFESETSKGSFYHYFDGKDALLSTLSDLFDDKYEALEEVMTPDMPAMEKLLFLNRELFETIENTVPMELLSQLFATQLVTSGEKHLLDHLLPPSAAHHRPGPGRRAALHGAQRQRAFQALRPV